MTDLELLMRLKPSDYEYLNAFQHKEAEKVTTADHSVDDLRSVSTLSANEFRTTRRRTINRKLWVAAREGSYQVVLLADDVDLDDVEWLRGRGFKVYERTMGEYSEYQIVVSWRTT